MANPSKRTGTGYENRILEKLREVYGQARVERSPAGTPGRDFTGTQFPCEAKKGQVKNWRIPSWIKYQRELHGERWCLFVGPKDRRRSDQPPEVMIVPLDLGLDLLGAYLDQTYEDIPADWSLDDA